MLLQKTLIFLTALLHGQCKCGYFVGDGIICNGKQLSCLFKI